MKECPNCKKIYGDELFFCLDDGSPLRAIADDADPNAPTVGAFDVTPSLRTEVLPSRPVPHTVVINSPEQPSAPQRSKFPYIAIGVLALTCVALAATLVVLNLDRFSRQSNAPSANATRNEAISTPVPAPSQTPIPKTPSPLEKVVAATPSSSTPIGHWAGSWSTESGTRFDFELRLVDSAENALSGQIKWTMRKTARPDKESKVGLSATEFVRGTFEPSDGTVRLKGHRKDDPDNVLVMLDEYKLKISPDGKSLTGLARNGGKWNGNVRLSRRTAGD